MTYAHLAVTAEAAVKLKAQLDDVNFHGRVLMVTDECPEVESNSPSGPEPEYVQNQDLVPQVCKEKDNSGGLNPLK